MTARQLKILQNILAKWEEADEDYGWLRMQADPHFAQILVFKGMKEEIPDIEQKIKEAKIKADALWEELRNFNKLFIDTNEPLVEESQPENPISSKMTDSPRPEPVAENKSLNEYERLKQRVDKGREYLKREYWTAYGGKGRKDPQMLKEVELWMDLNWRLIQMEQKHE